MISFVVAMDKNRVIGKNGRLPWRLPDDMRWFRQVTMGKSIIMGRKTYESIPDAYRPLPGRDNIVLTHQPDYEAPGATVVHSMDRALLAAAAEQEVMVGGGAGLYQQLLPQASRLYLTLVQAEFEGDTYFPAFDESEWLLALRESHPADARHAVPFEWVILERKMGTGRLSPLR